jgi:hypothetical protein
MPISARYVSSFTSSTLKTIETHAAQFQVSDSLFFRGAYTANVVENERRKFAPVIVFDVARVMSSRCTCSPRMRPNDLCRHLAVLVERMTGDDGVLPSEKFEQCVWRAIAFASFSDGREMRAEDGDPREQMLRRYVLTEQEQALLSRGSGSARLLFEASPWYRWSKQMFLRGANDARLEMSEGAFALLTESERVALPPAAVEHVIAFAPDIVTSSGFEIAPQSLAPSLRIEITRNRALRFTPVLLGGGGAVMDRDALPKFGKYLLAGNRFTSPAAASPMFIEAGDRPQATLFEVRSSAGLPYDRETVIAENDVFAFVERHRQELASLPEELAPETVRNARPMRLDGDVTFDFAAPHKDFLEVEITFDAGAETITAADIARARRDGVRALIRGSLWIDVTDPQFGWLDDATLGPQGHILVTKLELLRIRGSLRGKAIFRGDTSCERMFRLFDEIQTDVDAPATSRPAINGSGFCSRTGLVDCSATTWVSARRIRPSRSFAL